eukprot:XP_015577922.1 uncharacterized protein LOC107261659 [Ricinus communis]
MEAYFDAIDVWEAVEQEYEIPPLPNNPTMAQIKNYRDRKQQKSKAKASLFAAVSTSIFNRIITMRTAKEIWDFLKQEYEGDERVRGIKSLNLCREFELEKMKELETIKEYSDKLLGIVNNVRLLGFDFSDSRIVQEPLITIPERFKTTISSLENMKDPSTITLAKLLNALQAQEQRRRMRQGGTVEGALQAKLQSYNGGKSKKKIQNKNKQPGGLHNKKEKLMLLKIHKMASKYLWHPASPPATQPKAGL